MVKHSIAIALLIGISQAKCPIIGPEMFREILNNRKEEIVIKGKRFEIDDREIPNFAIQSKHKPKISVRNKSTKREEVCEYTRTIGGKKFGSFELERDKKNIFILKNRTPDTVIIEKNPVFSDRYTSKPPGWKGDYYRHDYYHRY